MTVKTTLLLLDGVFFPLSLYLLA